MEQKDIWVAILHPNRLFRECLALALAKQTGIAGVSTTAGFNQIDGELTSGKPVLFLLDFGWPTRMGLEEAQQIRAASAEFKILMIGVPDSEEDVLACIECGASGYVLQDASFEELIANVRAVVAGETLCPPRIASLAFVRLSQLARQSRTTRADHPTPLTRREREIIAAIEKGLSNKEIAVQLGIEVSTVKNHVHNVLDKLKQHNRESAVHYAKVHGMVASLH